jgi:hypothetical protein
VPETPPDAVLGSLCEKATIHLVAPGTSILEKLHSLVKYLGTNLELKLLEFPVTVAFDFDPESLGFDKVLLGVCDEFADPNKFPTIAVAVDIRLDVLFFDESSAENTWIVPWLLDATNKLESGLNHRKKGRG